MPSLDATGLSGFAGAWGAWLLWIGEMPVSTPVPVPTPGGARGSLGSPHTGPQVRRGAEPTWKPRPTLRPPLLAANREAAGEPAPPPSARPRPPS